MDQYQCNYEHYFSAKACVIQSAALVDEDEQFQRKHQPAVYAVEVETFMEEQSNQVELLT